MMNCGFRTGSKEWAERRGVHCEWTTYDLSAARILVVLAMLGVILAGCTSDNTAGRLKEIKRGYECGSKGNVWTHSKC